MNNQQQVGTVPKWAANWESRAKLIAAIGYIFGVISLTNLPYVMAAYVLSVIVFVVMKIPITLLLQRYLIITPFLLLMTVPLLWQQETGSVIFAMLILLKAFTSMTIITIVLESQSLDQLVNGLAGFRIPLKLITILVLSYRYVFMFLEDIDRMLTAAKSRFFRGGINVGKLRVYGQLTAGLLVRAIERSDNMYKAMASRGFDGQLQFSPPKRMTSKDIIKTVLAISIITIIIVIERSSFFS
ncbi:energy-coupling factor transporter transmembrane component T family protein [Aquibacillus sediminis]|uniref:energy-coupling factor transporter transmembrane component T family protein n=1 Tax=Aquibacillus sediminis TaxID=2574734 RepID=UPI001486B034|nr:energy-coupling factor transporter transmembrane component T [Aquibacillus sediminis]